MIVLEVEPYCQECLSFEPDVEKPEKVIGWASNEKEELILGDTVIRCEYRNRCKNLCRYLAKQQDKDQS